MPKNALDQWVGIDYGDDDDAGITLKRVFHDRFATMTIQTGAKNVKGDKYAVVCGGQQFDFDKLEEAQAKAEELAHQHNANAFILKPIKKVAPKRDVVTTDL